jgi:site-specific DNA-methyltransferase (adenine-specific)
MPSQSVDVIVTSPPYNVGTDYGEHKDNESRGEYLINMATWGLSARRALKDEGSLFLNIAGKPSDPWIPYDVLNSLRESFVLQNTIHWIKSIAIDDKTVGHFKPINSPRYLNQTHEFIFHLTKTGNVGLDRLALGVPYTDESNLKRWVGAQENKLHCRGNSWYLPYETKQEKGIHPATFPMALPDACLRLHGYPSDEDARASFVVWDPFCGTGASALAAARVGLSFVGCDINRDYLEEAVRRLQAVGVTADLQ